MKYEDLRSELISEALGNKRAYKFHKQLVKAFHMAWELGHANGDTEVRGYFWEIVAIIKEK